VSPLLVVLVTVLAAPAQAPEPPERPAADRPERSPGEEAAKMVDAYVVSNLQESLGLSDEQFVKLLPLVKRLQSDRREYMLARRRSLRELRRLLESGTATETQVAERLREVKRFETEGPAKLQKTNESIDTALTPLQQAKFRVLEADIERKIRDILGQVRRQGRPAPRGEHPPGDQSQ
jgi:Spy/CpxP family protein refolding chaperone